MRGGGKRLRHEFHKFLGIKKVIILGVKSLPGGKNRKKKNMDGLCTLQEGTAKALRLRSPGFSISPCAYFVGGRAIAIMLNLRRRYVNLVPVV